MASTDITCLFCHKCSEETHDFGKTLQTKLESSGIELLIDRFGLGDDVNTRIDSFDFDALLFLSSPESLASRPCKRELRTARRLSVPVFLLIHRGRIPNNFRSRILWSPPHADSPEFAAGVTDLAESIRARVNQLRHLRRLQADAPPDQTRDAAKAIALETDPKLVAENLSVLGRRYMQLTDPATRFWIAQAVGSAGTPKAAKLLDKLPKKDHPYALEGIRQAREMITRGS